MDPICTLAYEGKLLELTAHIQEDYTAATRNDQDDRQPLHWACSAGRNEVIDYLVHTCHVPIDLPDDSGWTPLIIAASAGREHAVTELLRKHADVKKTTDTGVTALHYAASKNHRAIVEMLLSNDAGVDAREASTGATPLHRAASRGHVGIVEMLLRHKASVDVKDTEGNTPLHMACEEERTDIAEILQQHGASIESLNKEEKTPLDLAPAFLVRRLKGD